MGNESSHLAVWRQPGVADIARHAGAVDKDRYSNCPQTIQPTKLAAELSKKAMLKVQKRVLAEYPYLSTVQESMVVCDNRQPDCPIVYVNDEFEKLTLYPKEEIIGRNCRFLQGKYTNKETVKKIRSAVDNGLPLDIELFNYRKDGTGFFNNFLMLPVHKSKGSKVVSHFIAIQKDISVVKKDSNAQLWAPPECAMWFDYLNMGRYSELLVQNEIDGKTLMTLNDEDMLDLGIDDAKDREVLLRLLVRLQRKPEAAYQALERNLSCSGTPSLYTGAADEVCLASPRNQELWRKEGQKERNRVVAVKCFFKDEIVIFRGEAIKFAQINKLIENTWHMSMKLKCTSGNDSKVVIKNSADWKKVVKEGGGHVVLHLSKRLKAISESAGRTFDLLGVLVVLVDWEGTILFVNKAAKLILGRSRDNLLHLPHTDVFPGLELRVVPEGEWSKIEAQGKRKIKLLLSASVALFDDTVYMIQAVPLARAV